MFDKVKYASCHKHDASALVITLSVLVLLCICVVAFFNQSTQNRQISFSSAGQYRADAIAQTGIDTIVGDLRSEIFAGSVEEIKDDVAVYTPNANATIIPFRLKVNNLALPNLVRQSTSGVSCWPTNNPNYKNGDRNPVRSAGDNNTATPSLNHRYIKATRWNRPGLLCDPGSGSESIIPERYAAPDWVLVTRNGAINDATHLPSVKKLADKNVTNMDFAIGRFAYAIYDEGGLLDINIAGFPNSLAGSDFSTKRGLLGQVDLANIPGIDTIDHADAIVRWRNIATAASPDTYKQYVLGSTNGFLSVPLGDQAFVSRKDLINYALANPSNISTSALQYVGTFSRQVNAPSYSPNPARPKVVNLSGFNFAPYGKDDLFNPSLINTRVTKEFRRDSDGSLAKIGESLLKYRFPLSRLALITKDAIADSGSDIYKYFGLTRSSSSSPWTYNHGNNSGILKLSEVADIGREPDFFELLQASIAIGSLGQGLKNNALADTFAFDTHLYYQIIQIGANIIDQFDADSYVTRIVFDSNTFCGIENLPYLNSVYEAHLQTSGQYDSWYVPEIWTPHCQTIIPTGQRPTQFRFITSGTAYASFDARPADATPHLSGTTTFTDTNGITFAVDGTNKFDYPSILTGYNASATFAKDSAQSANFLGVYVGTVNGVVGTASGCYTRALIYQNVTHKLQYLENGVWVTYSSAKNVTGHGTMGDSQGYTKVFYSLNGMYQIRADPRTDRFGSVIGNFPAPFTYAHNQTIRPTTAAGRLHNIACCPTGANPYWTSTTLALGFLSENSSSSPCHYADPDNVVRRADGAYANGAASDGGYPMADMSSYPVVLNRPFRSVADMGYAFRDEPWKHLDFFTAESADAALLDVFCLNESPAPRRPDRNADPLPLAGCVNLNGQQPAVFQAILSGVIKAEEANTTIARDNAGKLADNLVSITQSAPLLNRSELVTRWISASSIGSCMTGASDAIIKRRREAAVRALCDLGNTRTWNLLIDIIAQSGRYPLAASNLNDFLVQGERRYWLHIAIDRYTGKVVDQSLEAVYE